MQTRILMTKYNKKIKEIYEMRTWDRLRMESHNEVIVNFNKEVFVFILYFGGVVVSDG